MDKTTVAPLKPDVWSRYLKHEVNASLKEIEKEGAHLIRNSSPSSQEKNSGLFGRSQVLTSAINMPDKQHTSQINASLSSPQLQQSQNVTNAHLRPASSKGRRESENNFELRGLLTLRQRAKIEPKSFLANERTWLQWFNACTLAASVALVLISGSEEPSHYLGVGMLVIMLALLVYSLVVVLYLFAFCDVIPTLSGCFPLSDISLAN